MNEVAREHCRAAKVAIKGADQLLEDAGALHEAGERGAAALIHDSINDMHETALRHLEAVPEQPDDDDPEAKQQRARFAARRLMARKR